MWAQVKMKCKTIHSYLLLTLDTIIGTSLGTRGKQENAGLKTMAKSEFHYTSEKSAKKCSMYMKNLYPDVNYKITSIKQTALKL